VPNSDPPAKDYPLSRARGQYRRVSGRWQLKPKVILTRLRMGHTKLNSTLHIIGKHGTGLCKICQVKETVVLLFCSRYELERKDLISELKEMGCKEFTINNILNSGLRTRI